MIEDPFPFFNPLEMKPYGWKSDFPDVFPSLISWTRKKSNERKRPCKNLTLLLKFKHWLCILQFFIQQSKMCVCECVQSAQCGNADFLIVAEDFLWRRQREAKSTVIPNRILCWPILGFEMAIHLLVERSDLHLSISVVSCLFLFSVLFFICFSLFLFVPYPINTHYLSENIKIMWNINRYTQIVELEHGQEIEYVSDSVWCTDTLPCRFRW